ncbi:hypothetical protein JZ785_11345 [Alicyclobacillus curvatus]|nr:hypothetical protein JZ785_11345 [Alicyclobacillus curvatus]
MDVQRRKRTRIIVASCLGVVLALVILFQAIDMTRQHRIRQDVREALTSKLVSMDLKDATRVKSTIGNYFIPDVNSNKVRNDLMNTLYPQVLEYVNVFNLSGASPFFMAPSIVESYLASSRADPTIYIQVGIKYTGLFGIVRNLQVMQSYPVPHYQDATSGLN